MLAEAIVIPAAWPQHGKAQNPGLPLPRSNQSAKAARHMQSTQGNSNTSPLLQERRGRGFIYFIGTKEVKLNEKAEK